MTPFHLCCFLFFLVGRGGGAGWQQVSVWRQQTHSTEEHLHGVFLSPPVLGRLSCSSDGLCGASAATAARCRHLPSASKLEGVRRARAEAENAQKLPGLWRCMCACSASACKKAGRAHAVGTRAPLRDLKGHVTLLAIPQMFVLKTEIYIIVNSYFV